MSELNKNNFEEIMLIPDLLPAELEHLAQDTKFYSISFTILLRVERINKKQNLKLFFFNNCSLMLTLLFVIHGASSIPLFSIWVTICRIQWRLDVLVPLIC